MTEHICPAGKKIIFVDNEYCQSFAKGDGCVYFKSSTGSTGNNCTHERFKELNTPEMIELVENQLKAEEEAWFKKDIVNKVMLK